MNWIVWSIWIYCESLSPDINSISHRNSLSIVLVHSLEYCSCRALAQHAAKCRISSKIQEKRHPISSNEAQNIGLSYHSLTFPTDLPRCAPHIVSWPSEERHAVFSVSSTILYLLLRSDIFSSSRLFQLLLWATHRPALVFHLSYIVLKITCNRHEMNKILRVPGMNISPDMMQVYTLVFPIIPQSLEFCVHCIFKDIIRVLALLNYCRIKSWIGHMLLLKLLLTESYLLCL